MTAHAARAPRGSAHHHGNAMLRHHRVPLRAPMIAITRRSEQMHARSDTLLMIRVRAASKARHHNVPCRLRVMSMRLYRACDMMLPVICQRAFDAASAMLPAALRRHTEARCVML